jgi:hypothetical protein
MEKQSVPPAEDNEAFSLEQGCIERIEGHDVVIKLEFGRERMVRLTVDKPELLEQQHVGDYIAALVKDVGGRKIVRDICQD